ncbi:MAG: aspartate kinase, partial [Bacteroidales bacterium]|nr:aspartate kinase [Bacteroidales bacterium]
MRVLKFGGASVKDAESVRNIPDIISKYRNNELVIIVSAMAKTTNALEALTEAAHAGSSETGERFSGIFNYHQQIIEMLFPDGSHEIYGQIRELFDEIKHWLKVLQDTEREYDFDLYYDQIVSIGELLSTRIVSAYLAEQGYANTWLDARELIMTDHTYRAAKIDWETTYDRIHTLAVPELQKGKMVISQGFIGSTGEFSTTLGREGSDFSAAIFANILDAEEVVVWKDVPGYLNADPKYFKDTVKLDKISYTETIELAFYGAKIIHPKTIRPLKNKSIPLL